ncbi:MAG: ABC transporter permease subunit [Bryobacterales bacterium]|nr:ABC transporter permease subunit [Bryobacterales bacterium]
MELNAIALIARQEMTVCARSRWLVGFAAVFGVLSLAIAYFGTVTAGAVGIQGFERTAASLVSLVLYLVPLLGLMLAGFHISTERAENELLFSQPVARRDILFGRLLGMFATMSGAIAAGFGLSGGVILVEAGSDGALRFLGVMALTLLLTAVFLAMGAAIGLMSKSRAQALGAALGAWFFFVIFYDLAVMGMTFVLRERTANNMIFLSLFGNPVGLARVLSLTTLSDPAIFGPAGAALLKFLGGTVQAYSALVLGLCAWIIAPLALAARMIRRMDL